VPCGAIVSVEDIARLRAAFDATHKQQFGHAAPDEVVEIVSWRVQSTGLVPPVAARRFEPTGAKLSDALRERRPVRFAGRLHDTPVYQRERLDVGHEIAGPAVVEQYDCTTVIEPGQVAKMDALKNLVVRRHRV
jgi:N-methylhydantoinase A